MSDLEQPGQSKPDDESGELVEPKDDAQEPGDAVVKMPKFDPFAGLDVGKIMPSIDFSQYLPKISPAITSPQVTSATTSSSNLQPSKTPSGSACRTTSTSEKTPARSPTSST